MRHGRTDLIAGGVQLLHRRRFAGKGAVQAQSRTKEAKVALIQLPCLTPKGRSIVLRRGGRNAKKKEIKETQVDGSTVTAEGES